MDLSVPCGKFHVSYRQDLAVVRSKVQGGLLIAFVLVMLLLPGFIGGTWVGLINLICITLIAVLGLNILTGYCGLISMGQSAFMGIGAYTCAILANQFNLPFYITIPSAGLASGLIGIFFGLPAVRIKGFYLIIATVAAQHVFEFAILHLPESVTGQVSGLSVAPATLGSLTFDSEVKMYYLILLFTALAIFFAKNIARTRVGRAFVAIRDNDLAAEAMGINLFYYKVLAFFVCSVFAGVAGALTAYHVRYIGIDQFTVWFSIWFIGMLIVGGMGSVIGAIFGVVFLKVLQEAVVIAGPFFNNIFPGIGAGIVFSGVNVLFGLAIMLFLIFEPKGIAHRWELFKSYYRLFPFRY